MRTTYEPKPDHLFSFGDRVTFDVHLERKVRLRPADDVRMRADELKLWVEVPRHPTTGLWLGTRRLENGVRRWEEYGPEFRPEFSFFAHLVAYSEHRKPVYVPDHAITIAGGAA